MAIITYGDNQVIGMTQGFLVMLELRRLDDCGKKLVM